MKKYIFLGLVVLVIFLSAWYFLYANKAVAPISEIQLTYQNGSAEMIVIDTPKVEARVTAPITVRGKARGMWYFEARFPIEVQNADGIVIGQGFGIAEGEWMTEDFVPFTATVNLDAQYSGPAMLIIKKDNPSGEEILDASVAFPITIE